MSNQGGGVYIDTGGRLTLLNSTVSGHSSSYEGTILNRGTLNIYNTLMGNNTGGDCVHTSAGMGLSRSPAPLPSATAAQGV